MIKLGATVPQLNLGVVCSTSFLQLLAYCGDLFNKITRNPFARDSSSIESGSLGSLLR